MAQYGGFAANLKFNSMSLEHELRKPSDPAIVMEEESCSFVSVISILLDHMRLPTM